MVLLKCILKFLWLLREHAGHQCWNQQLDLLWQWGYNQLPPETKTFQNNNVPVSFVGASVQLREILKFNFYHHFMMGGDCFIELFFFSRFANSVSSVVILINDFSHIYKWVLIGCVHNMFYILEDITIGGGAEVFIDVTWHTFNTVNVAITGDGSV